jgi:glycine/D-amino acid oxidase-like deaminating enzyme
MKNSEKSILVVGAGLSGVSVSVQLLQAGAKVTLIDNGINHSSRIAAGLINPLVFRRMTKSWRADEFIHYLKTFYRELQKATSQSFFHPMPVRRLFATEQEHDLWLEKQRSPQFEQYMHPLSEEDYNYSEGKNPHGSGRVKETFCINVAAFFNATQLWIKKNGVILFEEFDTSTLEKLHYKGVKYDEIVFCQGYLNPSNKWFGALPIEQTKGELLTIKSELLPEDVSLNRKSFVLPIGKQTFKVGSNYAWNDPTTHVTEQAKREILHNLSFITDDTIIQIDQEAGVRPTTRNRRPLIGTHPEHKNYHIFNGLGAKGYMLAPLLSKEFVDHILKGAPLNTEVDIKRHF